MNRDRMLLENRFGELARIESWLEDLFERWAVPDRGRYAVDLVINEAVTNIISYAYRDDAVHHIAITLTDGPDSIVIEIVDDGEPFDPLAAAPMAPPTDLAHTSIGGHGIHLIKAFSTAQKYTFASGHNRLTLTISKQGNIQA